MKVKLWCSTHDLQSRREDIVEYPDDLSNEDLEVEAEEFFWNEKEPCWGYEIL
jgi:hypothetical protein